MLTPKIPVNDQPTGQTIPLSGATVEHHQAPAPVASQRPTVQLTPGSLALLVGGGSAAVLVIGTVLVSMLLAVAITAGSLAIVALVVRSLMSQERK
ncbi:SpdD-like protein [Streptomyces sp. BH055]|uniref:SpdD-like protein n=1 Tax=Streptomyces sp. BH055 TaxID=3401173 RepID=UPI003BB62DA0